jgi:hypothetical protein
MKQRGLVMHEKLDKAAVRSVSLFIVVEEVLCFHGQSLFTSTCVHCFVVGVQIEKLRLAAEMLPPNDSYQKAARLVEQAMQVGLALAALHISSLYLVVV